MQLCRATQEDALRVHALLVECGVALAAAGYDNWNPPARLEQVARDISDREVYVVGRGEDIVATVTVGLEPTVPYVQPQWLTTTTRALYVNRLAVSPRLQSRGIGQWLTKEMEQRARDLGCGAVRLDALADNAPLLQFYERAGYTVRFHREHSGWRFACLEKAIAGGAAD